jgi:hypothetical protein
MSTPMSSTIGSRWAASRVVRPQPASSTCAPGGRLERARGPPPPRVKCRRPSAKNQHLGGPRGPALGLCAPAAWTARRVFSASRRLLFLLPRCASVFGVGVRMAATPVVEPCRLLGPHDDVSPWLKGSRVSSRHPTGRHRRRSRREDGFGSRKGRCGLRKPSRRQRRSVSSRARQRAQEGFERARPGSDTGGVTRDCREADSEVVSV